MITALVSLLMFTIGSSISSFYSYNSYTIAQSYEVSQARRGIESLVRDIREMTYADDGTFPLAVMETDNIGFYSDIDRDDSVEYVEYGLAGTTLTKNVYNATGAPPVYNLGSPDEVFTISEYVQNLSQVVTTFSYFTETGTSTATSTVTDIKYVVVELVVNIDPIRDPGEFTLRSSASLRNLKDE